MPGNTNGFWQVTGLVVAQTLFSLLIFSALVALLVFMVRKPLRRYKPVDMSIFNSLEKYVNPHRNKRVLFFTRLGSHQFLIPANLLLILYFLFIRKQSWFSVRVAVISLSSLVLMLLLKQLFKRKRPLAPLLHAAKGLSFPSGHSIMAVTFYGLLMYIIYHTVEMAWVQYILYGLLVILVLLIGLSRIYLRVHYASDVLAGFIIGLSWLFISLSVLEQIELMIMSSS